MFNLRPKIICKNGFEMSVQASKYHYCTPRLDEGPYESVEVGFPSHEEQSLMEYAEDPKNPTETVYGYVPVPIVLDVIERNGGVDFAAMGVNNFFLCSTGLD